MTTAGDEFSQYLKTVEKFDPHKMVELVSRLGLEWADADAAASSLEEAQKSLRAKFALDYQEHGDTSGKPGEKPRPMSMAQAELRALSDPRYEAHVDMMVDARRCAQRLRVRYDMGKMYLELQRTLQATLRAEMRMSGQ